MIPETAILEAIVDHENGDPGIAIYDVSHILREEALKLATKARAQGKRRKKLFGTRDPSLIDTAIVHKSGGNGPRGFKGCMSTMTFVVYHRGWDGAAYTFWFSKIPDRDEKNRIVVYRMQPDHVKSWHTGGKLNEFGIGLGVQGNYDGNWDLLSSGLPKIDRQPTPAQFEALRLGLRYVLQRYDGINIGQQSAHSDHSLTGHWEHGKLCCPGDALRAWVERTRTGAPIAFKPGRPEIPERVDGEVDPFRFTPEQYQKALYYVGFNPGPIDGILGDRTRAALEEFQEFSGVEVDGWYGLETAKAMKFHLTSLQLIREEDFRKGLV
jgi:putative peptidoglycan binding protein/N-acetylmuramoyl-L-alanine amidase-like protein